MVDIGRSDKLNHLWPATPPRPIDSVVQADRSSRDKKRQKKEKDGRADHTEEGPGKNFDDYA